MTTEPLANYLLTAPRGTLTRWANALDVSRSFMSQMASGAAAISHERAVLIEAITGRAVTRQMLFPETWQRIWPELAAAPCEVPPAATPLAPRGGGAGIGQKAVGAG